MASSKNTQEILPNDLFAEQAVLGAIISKNEVLDEIAPHLSTQDFFSPAHQRIYDAILALSERQAPIDEVTIGSILKDRQQFDDIGGSNYLIEIAQSAPVVEHVEYYSKIVKEKGRLRELIHAAADISKEGRSSSEGVDELVLKASHSIQQIEDKLSTSGYAHLKQILLQQFEELEQRSNQPDSITGVATGFKELDELTLGLQPSDLIILAARPSMGKTAFALNIALYAAAYANTSTLVFSLEMPKEQLAMRLLCSESKVDSHKLRLGNLSEEDWDKLAVAAAKLTESNILIDDKPAITHNHIRNILRQTQKKYNVGLVIIDYLQLMKSAMKYGSREQEISEISNNLKAIAKEYNVPVVALSQLNRDLERRADKRPIMADLRESGAIEQDADLIMFIYRDEVYNEATEDAGIAEIILAKHRNGEIGTKRLAFIAKYTKFANLSIQEDI